MSGKTYNVGAFQGGGTRGIMQAEILARLESQLGQATWQTFGLLAGTSVGGIVAGCLAAGVPASEMVKFFRTAAPQIFRASWFQLPRLWSAAKYDPSELRTALTSVVGKATLADCKTRFIASAVEMKSGRNAYFQSYGTSSADEAEIVIGPDSGMLLTDVMLATSAAQSYFPGHAWGGHVFWDGGNTGNNAPDMLAFTEARQWAGEAGMQMLSLGGGKTPWKFAGHDLTNPSLKTVLAATLEIVFACGEANEVWQARTELGGKHHRLNPRIADYGIDDASPATLAAMQWAAVQEWAAHPELIPAFQ